jgi:hypothetical protein
MIGIPLEHGLISAYMMSKCTSKFSVKKFVKPRFAVFGAPHEKFETETILYICVSPLNSIRIMQSPCRCRVRVCRSAYKHLHDTSTIACFNCCKCCPMHKHLFSWQRAKLSSSSLLSQTQSRPRTRMQPEASSFISEDFHGASPEFSIEETPEGTLRSKSISSRAHLRSTTGRSPSSTTLLYEDVFSQLASCLGKQEEMQACLVKCRRRKFRLPKSNSVFQDLDRKYVGALNKCITLVLLWLAECLLPSDPLTLLAEFKIYSPDLRKTELSLIKPVRRLVRQFKAVVRPLRQLSTERRTLEAVASILGSEFFSYVVDASSTDEEDMTEEGEEEESDDESSTRGQSPEHSRSGFLRSVKATLFSRVQRDTATKRPHKVRLATAVKNRKLLMSGKSLEMLRKFKFRTVDLEKAVSYILAHVKVKGFETTRLTLSQTNGNFTIPWLYRTMPREALWQGYLKLNPDKCERMKRTNFRALVDALTRNEVQPRTGIDYIAQEYGLDTFNIAADVIQSMGKEGLLEQDVDIYLAEVEQCKTFTMRWYKTHVNSTTAGDGFYQHGTWWGLSHAPPESSSSAPVLGSMSTAASEGSSSAPTTNGFLMGQLGASCSHKPAKHCTECTRFVVLLHSLEQLVSTAAKGEGLSQAQGAGTKKVSC